MSDIIGTRGNVNFADLGTIVNGIVIEAMCLYLSGALDELETEDTSNDDLSENRDRIQT